MKMSRTLLYYPYIEIPTSGQWLRSALLYWDQVAAVVPRSYDDMRDEDAIQRYSSEIRDLHARGIFRPINPDGLVRDEEKMQRLKTDVLENVDAFLKNRERKTLRCTEPIFQQKLTMELSYALEERGVVERRKKTRQDHFCFYFEPAVADIYMALLADYLAQNERSLTIPSTDRPDWIIKTFGGTSGAGASLGISTRLLDVLPQPETSVSIDKLLRFRDKYRGELLDFRQEMDKVESDLASAKDDKQIRDTVTKASEKIERECLVINKALKGSRIGTLLGSISSLLKAGSPTILVSGTALMTNVAYNSQVPALAILKCAIAGGFIEVAVNYFKERIERRSAALKSPFAYLILAKKKRLLRP